MDHFSICVTFIAGILSIAYPILLEVMSRIDEKYGSLLILDYFNKEVEKKWFVYLLVASLTLIGFWMLNLPPAFPIFANSALYLLIGSTIALIVFFFLFVRKILIYYTPSRFLKYLVANHDKTPLKNELESFRALSELTYYAIRNQNETLGRSLYEFMYKAFKSVREQQNNKPVEYYRPYYELVTRCIEECSVINNLRLRFLEHRTAGSIWLLGEFERHQISDITFSWLWRNILTSLANNKDDNIINHWETAHQHLNYSLPYLDLQHDENFHIVNQAEITQRQKERKKFIEFHFALGGLLLYAGKYRVIGRMFKFTNSWPPTYELLPDTMDEVFASFFWSRDLDFSHEIPLSSRFSFPSVEGIRADEKISEWMERYSALLFLRQYSLIEHYVYETPLAFPKIPESQSEKRQWIEQLDVFKGFVMEVMDNRELLANTGLDYITNDWCRENGKLVPTEFFDKLKANIQENYEETDINQTLSQEKVEHFFESSLAILKPVFQEYISLNNPNAINGDTKSWYIHGTRTLFDKQTFSDSPEVTHLNYNTVLAEIFRKQFRGAISQQFHLARTKSYTVRKEDLKAAVQALNISGGSFVVVSFDISNDEIGEIKNILPPTTEFIFLVSENYRFIGESIFVLKKDDLPNLIYREIASKEVERSKLSKINAEFNLYATVIDLNTSEELRKEQETRKPNQDLQKSALAGLFINVEVKWKKDFTCLQIQLASPFRERGVINEVSEIKPFN